MPEIISLEEANKPALATQVKDLLRRIWTLDWIFGTKLEKAFIVASFTWSIWSIFKYVTSFFK